MDNAARIVVARDGAGLATVTIDRAEKRNALDLSMWTALRDAFAALSGDGALRCVVLRGAGDEAFSAGADIGAFAAERDTPEREALYARMLHEGMAAVRACVHPVVGALSGWCMGGGAGIASMCDFRVAGESLRLGIPARSRGIWYPHAELDVLLQLAGYATAMELLVEGRVFTGAEARAAGLVNRLVPDAAVQEEAVALARRVAEGAPLSNRWHKRALQRLRGPLPVTTAEAAEADACVFTEDFREASTAFAEKRRPVFTGR